VNFKPNWNRRSSKSDYSGARNPKIIFIAATIMSWLVLVCAGLGWLSNYANTPGKTAAPPAQWPQQSALLPSAEHGTLVMLAHPHCPCTRASIGELASIMAHTQGRLTAYVVFLKPTGFQDDWTRTDLWRSAEAIPGVKAIADDDGHEARLFQSLTSGQTFFYDKTGQLLFRGGITAARGHSGDNAGRSAIISIVNSENHDQLTTPVFGCPLFDPGEECRNTGKEKNAN
jgi:hypothetical protein